jgi:hypothetical protein
MGMLSQQAFRVSQVLRREMEQAGEVGAGFLLVWLAAVLVALLALLLVWAA